MTVIDGNTCDAKDHSRCGADAPTVTAGSGVSAVAVDQTNNTVYVADGDGTVSVIDGTRCDSLTVSGCHDTPHAVRTGAGTAAVVVDAKDHTVFALNGSDDTLSSIDAATCDGASRARARDSPRPSVALRRSGPAPRRTISSSRPAMTPPTLSTRAGRTCSS